VEKPPLNEENSAFFHPSITTGNARFANSAKLLAVAELANFDA
jgi:hypothetical protein